MTEHARMKALLDEVVREHPAAPQFDDIMAAPPSAIATKSARHRRLAPLVAAVVVLIGASAAITWRIGDGGRDGARDTVTDTIAVDRPAPSSPTTAAIAPRGPTVAFTATATQPPLTGRGDAVGAPIGGSVVAWWGNDKGAPDTAVYDLATKTWRVVAGSSRIGPRDKPVLLPIGPRVLLWGGRTIDSPLEYASGAIFDPANSSWTPIADSPIGGRNAERTAIVWSGTEVLVWGGRVDDARGAAYNPATNTWRQLSPSPLSPRRGAAFAWTGSQLLIWSGESFDASTKSNGFPTDGASYDPRTDTWRALPSILIPGRQVTGVWTGSEFLIVGGISTITTATFASGQFLHESIAAYDPVGDRWRQLPRGWSQPGQNNVLVGRLLTSWDGKFELAFDVDTGALLEIDRQGPELVVNDRAFAIPNGVAAAGVRDKTTNPRPELWIAVRA